MTHNYQITGMTCTSCEVKVKSALLRTPGIIEAEVSKEKNTATITMDKHIRLTDLQNALGENGKYMISSIQPDEKKEEERSWFEIYKPILLIFIYIILVTLIIQLSDRSFEPTQWMNHFMAGFFLVFSFFKFLNISGFAQSYAMYDIIAKRIPAWGYIYVFIEFALGIAYSLNFNMTIINATTFIVMGISIIGVLQTVLNKKKIQCACLGDVFNLPMSTVTIIEDGLMIAMSGVMLILI